LSGNSGAILPIALIGGKFFKIGLTEFGKQQMGRMIAASPQERLNKAGLS
jgi:hypothetical protein